MATTEERLTKLEGGAAAAGWDGFGSPPATGTPGNEVTANQTPGKALTWSPQAGDDSGACVGQGWTERSFVPPQDGSFKLDVSGRAPVVMSADIAITGPDGYEFKRRFDFGAYNDWVDPMKAGQKYQVAINPINPTNGGYAVRFEAGNIK